MRTSLAVFLTSFVLACGFLTSTAAAGVSTSCCLPLPEAGCLDAVAPAACEEAGGWPFGACASCAEFDCPPAACIGATEPCDAPHATPGCNDWDCCNCLCDYMPECCDPAHGWDESCVDYVNQYGCGCTGDHNAYSACFPDGSCAWVPGPFLDGGQTFGEPGYACLGDGDGDGIDDACGCPLDVPATSSHGVIAGAALLIAASAAFLHWRRRGAS